LQALDESIIGRKIGGTISLAYTARAKSDIYYYLVKYCVINQFKTVIHEFCD